MSASDRCDSQLYTLTLRALEDPLTTPEAREHDLIPWTALKGVEDALRAWNHRAVTNPAWNLPRLVQTLVDWGHDDPEGYAAFMAPVAGARASRLDTLPGLWHLDSVVRQLSDDHEFVLDTHDGVFCLGYQHQVTPWQSLIGPTALARAIQAHRGLPMDPAPEPTVTSPRRPRPR